MHIAGVIVPLLTPLRDDETIDVAAVARLVDHVIAGGVAGIFVLGSSGEAPALRPAERERMLSATVKAVAGRVPVLAGVIEPSTAQAVETARRYAELGADALVPTAPYYFIYSQPELSAHFRAVAAATAKPVVLYNIPVLVKQTISPELVGELSAVDNIVGLKDSDGQLDPFQRFLKLRSKKFQVWQGAEPVAAISMARGSDGAVLGLANIAPRMIVSMYEAASGGELATAWELQDRLMQLFLIQRHKSFLAGLKGAASLLGLCGARICLPFEPLTAEQLGKVRETLLAIGLQPAADQMQAS
jgi:4-hydroxy-tetrahydrodipicolinate synthase